MFHKSVQAKVSQCGREMAECICREISGTHSRFGNSGPFTGDYLVLTMQMTGILFSHLGTPEAVELTLSNWVWRGF